jgi:hypothetical protein
MCVWWVDRQHYVIEYDDGDKEDVKLDELIDVLLPAS